MRDSVFVAVPSDGPGGLDATPSAHFGRCACYTLARIHGETISDVSILPNSGLEQGDDLRPLKELAGIGIKALLAGGMGMRPFMGMEALGITPYFNAGHATVRATLEAFAEGRLPRFAEDNTRRGGHCADRH